MYTNFKIIPYTMFVLSASASASASAASDMSQLLEDCGGHTNYGLAKVENVKFENFKTKSDILEIKKKSYAELNLEISNKVSP